MKKTITTLLLLPFVILSQTIDYKNFNLTLFNKLIHEKISSHRSKLKLDTIYYSKGCEDKISKPNVEIMAKMSRCFHPDVNRKDSNINRVLIKDHLKISNGKYKSNKLSESFFYLAEVAYYTTKKFKTYDEFANDCLDGWLKSPKHREILESKYFLLTFGMSGVGYKDDKKGGYYVVYDIVELNISRF